MKILVVNDDPSFSDLLTRAVRRLGYTASAVATANEAIARLRASGFEAVITSLELPDMDGIELAALLRTEHDGLAIAFAGGSNDVLQDRAARIARVLPRVWTVAMLKDLVAALERETRKLATGTDRPELWPAAMRRAAGNALSLSASMRPSAPSLPPPPPREVPPVVIEELPPIDDEPDHNATAAGRPPSRSRMGLRKIRLSCRSWSQVERLCAQHAAGKNVLTLRGSYELQVHEPLIVALALPDELVLSLRAEVIAIREESNTQVYAIGLSGLTDLVVARLENMAATALGPHADLSGRPTRPLPRAQSEISFA